jgi:hypothetical protein
MADAGRRWRSRLSVAVCATAVGAAGAACTAEHTGHTPGPDYTPSPNVLPSSGPFAAHYGPGCNDRTRLACSDVLGLFQNAVTPDARAVIRPPDIDVTGGQVRGVESYWGLSSDVHSEEDTTVDSLTGQRFTLVQRGASFVVMRGRLRTGCYEARVSYVRSPNPGPDSARVIVSAEIRGGC